MRWAAHLFRRSVRRLRTRRPRRARLRFEFLEPREVPHVSGLVFIDLNQDGVQDVDDVGVAGVTVRATDDAGHTLTATTQDDGTYEIETDATNLRLEFSGLPEGTMPGRVVDTSGPVVRFLDSRSARTDVNLSLAAPRLVTTQFFYDHARTGWNSFEGAVLAFPYGSQDSVIPTVLAWVADVGSVWGLAYQASSNTVYASAFLKRHAGFGPNAAGTAVTTGGIYRINPDAEEPGATLLVDLNAAGFETGANPHPTRSEEDGGDWFHDPNALALVGKRSLGGLQAAPDGSALYTVNLNTRELITVPLRPDGTRDTARPITSIPVPLSNPAGSGIAAGDFAAANVRPFAVATKGNAVFVGVTYTAETAGSADDLRAFVYAYDPAQKAFRTYNPATGTFATSGPAAPVLIANLNYPRGVADDPTPDEPGDEVSAAWRPWTSTFNTSLGQDGFPVNPQPWLTDIVFDGDAMILGLRDRFGDQGGNFTGGPTPAGEDEEEGFYSAVAVGDILRAAPNGTGGWQLESAATAGGVSTYGAGTGQGPGNGEFYYQDSGSESASQEVTTGGLAQVPGFHTVAATGNDPLTAFSGGIYEFFNGNPDASARVAGTTFAQAEVYESFDQNTFGSANGLGDLEALPTGATVEVGDRVFEDANGNGLQDPGEPGLVGVEVLLFKGDAQVAVATTDETGGFLFSGLAPSQAYSVRIDTTQPALGGRPLTPADRGEIDELDSDATLNGTAAVATFTSPAEGATDYGIDIGFVGAQQTGNLTLGDKVFQDTNDNGKRDPFEPGIAKVAVELLDSTGTTILATTTTDSAGIYAFKALDSGTYVVRLAAGNFTGTGPLVGFTSSAATATDPNNDANDDDNGAPRGILGAGGFIVSGPVTLADGTEPATDGDGDARTNLTLDFGVVPPAPAGTLTLGNQVFNDANNNGTFDAAETGINGVTVELLDQGGAVVATDTTADGGFYAFTELAPGDYRVRLAASNFEAGGPLSNFTSSTATAADPDDNADNNNDGVVTGTLGSGGTIESKLVTLSAGDEPASDGDKNADTNLTLDFGVVVATESTLTLGDRVFNDANNNGTLDATETGMAGVTVQLFDDAGTVLQTVTTDATGAYSFANLAAGDYKVRLPAANFQAGGNLAGFTSSTATSSDPDDNADNNNDGTASGTLGTASGFIESGLVTLTANGEPTTDGDADATTNLTVDFGLIRETTGTSSLAGRVILDFNNNGRANGPDSGIPGVTISLSGGGLASPITVMTDADGSFSFPDLAAGTYTLTETQPSAPASQTGKDRAGTAGGNTSEENTISEIVLGTGEAATGYTFAEVPIVSTGGTVFEDKNRNGTRDDGEPGIAGVTITLSGRNVVSGVIPAKITITDASGNYTFSDLTPGRYTLTEKQPAGYFDGKEQNGAPAALAVSNNRFAGIRLARTADPSSGFNFGEVKPGSIAGAVFTDADDDGTQGPTGEPGVAGVTVRLTGTNDRGVAIRRSTKTGADGSYWFGNLRTGTYAVTEAQPAGFTDGKDAAGTSGGNATRTNDRVWGIRLTAGTTATGYLFGERTATPATTADLVLTRTPVQASIAPGGNVTFSFTVRNAGTQPATASKVVVTYDGLQFVNSPSTVFDGSTGTWTVGDLAPGASQTVQVVLRAPAAGTFYPSATASTTATESATANNTETTTVTAQTPPRPRPVPPLSLRWFLSSNYTRLPSR